MLLALWPVDDLGRYESLKNLAIWWKAHGKPSRWIRGRKEQRQIKAFDLYGQLVLTGIIRPRVALPGKLQSRNRCRGRGR